MALWLQGMQACYELLFGLFVYLLFAWYRVQVSESKLCKAVSAFFVRL